MRICVYEHWPGWRRRRRCRTIISVCVCVYAYMLMCVYEHWPGWRRQDYHKCVCVYACMCAYMCVWALTRMKKTTTMYDHCVLFCVWSGMSVRVVWCTYAYVYICVYMCIFSNSPRWRKRRRCRTTRIHAWPMLLTSASSVVCVCVYVYVCMTTKMMPRIRPHHDTHTCIHVYVHTCTWLTHA